jgi:hypothetical protein
MILTMAVLLRYLGGFHATLSFLCPKEYSTKKAVLQILSVDSKVEIN